MIDNRTKLYRSAYKMLSETNIYDKPIEDIGFGKDESRTTLIGILKQIINDNREVQFSYIDAYNRIVEAMMEYLSQYPTTYSFKQQARTSFKSWLKIIREKYKLAQTENMEEISDTGFEKDTGIAMVKALHPREGVSKIELCNELGINSRAIQKNLRKISNDLYEGDEPDFKETDYVPFKIGGQPLKSRIKLVERVGDPKRYYCTPNTVHPIVLQENLMQIGVLLKALCYYYNEFENFMSSLIAIDIWSQLSSYAKERIKLHYALKDAEFDDFIKMIEDECPDDHACEFKTERDICKNPDTSIAELLDYLTKGYSRECTVVKKRSTEVICNKQRIISYSNGSKFFCSVGNDGIERQFNIEEVDIVID